MRESGLAARERISALLAPLRGLADGLTRSVRFKPFARADHAEMAVFQFARMLRGPRSPAEVRAALVYLAHRVSGAVRVELELDELPGRPPRLAASWPRPDTEIPGPLKPRNPPGPYAPICIAIQFDGRVRGRLRLTGPGVRGFPATVLKRLETLCVLAAAAELRSARLEADSATHDALTGAHNMAYLSAFLTHALARARRRIEPVTLLCLAIDDFRALRDRHGDDLADNALARAARALSGTLRSSDVIARLDADRLVAVLPGCAAHDAARVAELVRHAVNEAEVASGLQSAPTASVGMATYPDHALEAGPLLAAAFEAHARACAVGTNRTASAPRLKSSPGFTRTPHQVG